jgi:signal transduction histidine kinase
MKIFYYTYAGNLHILSKLLLMDLHMSKTASQHIGFHEKLEEAAALRTLNAFAVDLISIPSVEDLFWYVARNVVGRLKFLDCVIYQANEAQTELTQVAALGEKNPYGRSILNPLKIPFGQGITGKVAASQEPIIIDDLLLDQNYITDAQVARSEICVPLICGNRIVGVIDSEHPDPAAFGTAELEILITIAALTSAKLELLSEADRSKKRYHDLVATHTQLSQEISNRKALEAELFNARKLEAVGRLTGRFAHEFNNLLTVVSGNLEFLEEIVEAGSPTETLNAAQVAARRGAELIASMLTFSQRTRLTPKITDLSAFIRSFHEKTSNERYGPVEFKLAPDIRQVNVDTVVLGTVLENLFGNARDVMPEEDSITVITQSLLHTISDKRRVTTSLSPGPYVRLSVQDTGGGISESSMQQIFDPFFTTKPVGNGIGLGLSMALGFMQQSGGTIEVTSEIGQGSTFHLYFPAV